MPIICEHCRQVLGEHGALAVVSRHRGREWRIVEGVIHCECGGEIVVRDGRPVELAREGGEMDDRDPSRQGSGVEDRFWAAVERRDRVARAGVLVACGAGFSALTDAVLEAHVAVGESAAALLAERHGMARGDFVVRVR